MKNSLSFLPISRSIFTVVVVFFGSLPLPASAMDIQYFMGNNLFYFDGGTGAPCSTVGSDYSSMLDIPLLKGSTPEEKVWNFLTGDAGLSPEQAAGIMGNINQESDFKPDAVESNGIGFGIVQWSFERRNGHPKEDQNKGLEPIGGIEKAALDKGIPATDLGFQLAYMVQESKDRTVDQWVLDRAEGADFGKIGDTEWDVLKKQTTAEDAAAFWHAAFERSADTRSQIQERLDDAAEYLKTHGKALSNLAEGTRDAFCSAVGSGDLKATVLEYAWPEYHEPGWIQMMPAYEEAVKRAQGDGRGVGGIAHPGIDCAGFVSLLLVDSGFDPEYNSKGTYAQVGEGGSTGEAIQRSWMKENWEFLGVGGSPEINVDMLLPGDVAVTYGSTAAQHIYLYVGQIDGFGNVFASASLDERAPMAAGTYENAVSNEYEWYRKK